ncbi:gamma-aminobutyric acid type B receptor subunit 1-like [Condylostylus longicornis]|uniref:gamma-aminobutyric acid type B receptor subunit 1-like n=1 Tax=Condylostylus longicornis TaxID=2530218 RepID=UPI00244E18D9|nr:gamma-aminobutyric acid type B receptor subunit 1-like [Condylostylus longicornis]
MTCDGVVTFWKLFIFLVFILKSAVTIGKPNQLHIGGIFPIQGKGGWQGGQACMPAAEMALVDVNRSPNILPGFDLELHSNDSEVSIYVNFLDGHTSYNYKA